MAIAGIPFIFIEIDIIFYLKLDLLLIAAQSKRVRVFIHHEKKSIIMY